MPASTPQEFIKSLQGDGVLLVIKDVLYFIPLDVLSNCKMPDPFQNNAEGVSEKYFKKEGAVAGANPNPHGIVFRGISKVLDDVYGLDGVNQAIWLQEATTFAPSGFVSKTGKSEQILFRYDAGKTKIVVDMSKGGRPSNG